MYVIFVSGQMNVCFSDLNIALVWHDFGYLLIVLDYRNTKLILFTWECYFFAPLIVIFSNEQVVLV